MDLDRYATLITDEISKAQLTINTLIKYKNENKISLYRRDIGLTVELRKYQKNGIRYKYSFRNFMVKTKGEELPKILYTKSINRILRELKFYIKKLQRQLSEYTKSKEN